MSALCEEAVTIYYQVVGPFVWFICAIAILLLQIVHCKTWMNGTLKTKSSTFFIGAFVLFLASFVPVCYAISFIYACDSPSKWQSWAVVAGISYSVEITLFVAFQVNKLHLTFKDSVYMLSKTSRMIFAIIIIASLIFTVPASIFYAASEWTLSSLFVSMVGALSVVMIIYLNVVFATKLLSVYKECARSATHQRMYYLITKSSLLAFISTSCYLIAMAVICLDIALGRTSDLRFLPLVVVWQFVIILDFSTNALSIILGYKLFEPYYQRICGVCHTHCVERLCLKCTQNGTDRKAQEDHELELERATSQSASTANV
mmetsp:Transcript_5210/g.8750  ORF Transcript_5210/g.8750 Transcript_5210/m.8750 type:complete len:317 (+) Transcript_5210:52-1002(+)